MLLWAGIGTLVTLAQAMDGVPKGTLGIVDDVKPKRIMVRWYLPNSSGRNLSLRDGFDKKRMLQYLQKVELGSLFHDLGE